MAVRIESQAEPIPGYKLIERIGGGGFGEVWKAEAPGGLHKAIKFVFGNLETVDADGARAEQELKALARVKSVRHPYILSLEQIIIIDGQLIIVMELADRNLWDRFREARAAGLPGIPKDELIGYMQEAAEALDLMNTEHDLQHLDIKPQNIFLVHNHIKVADFGLVKDLEGLQASVTGGVTPYYAAPETFEGWVSRYSDQYSLAIVYQELLTGKRPFNANNTRQLIVQHLHGQPDLESLPAKDRPAIAKALAKKPAERHPSCHDFIKALRRADKRTQEIDPEELRRYLSEVDQPTVPHKKGEKTITAEPGSDADSATLASPNKQAAADSLTPDSGRTPARPEQQGEGILFPSFVIGLGQLGAEVLAELRLGLLSRFGSLSSLMHLRLLYIDTDAETIDIAVKKELLSFEETLAARLNSRHSHYLRARDPLPPVEEWLDPKLIYRIPREMTTTGVRALGRLALIDNYRAIEARFRYDLDKITDVQAISKAAKQTGLGLRSDWPQIYVIANLAGGTGSGMFVDVAYILRSLLVEKGYPRADINGIFLLPMVDDNPAKALSLASVYAALLELNHFTVSGDGFKARYEAQAAPLRATGAPFQRCTFVSLPLEADAVGMAELVQEVASQLDMELLSPLGVEASRLRSKLATPTGPATFCSFGFRRIQSPRRALVQRASQHLGRKIIERWLQKLPAEAGAPIRLQMTDFLQNQKLDTQGVLAELQAACIKELEQAPEQLFTTWMEPIKKTAAPALPSAGTVREYLQQVEQLLGSLQEMPASWRPPRIPTSIQQASEQALNRVWHSLNQTINQFLDKSGFRQGGAEEAVRQTTACVEDWLKPLEQQGEQLAAKLKESGERLQFAVSECEKNPAASRLSKAQRATLAANLPDLLMRHPLLRYQQILVQSLVKLYYSLRGRLSDKMRELGYCRQRLRELVQAFTPQDQEPPAVAPSEEEQGPTLLPSGCRTLEEAVSQTVAAVTTDDLRQMDESLQTALQAQFPTLAQLATSPGAEVIRRLHLALTRAIEELLQGRMAKEDVAQLFFAQKDMDASAIIGHALEETKPAFADAASSEKKESMLLAVPDSDAGRRFLQMAQDIQPAVKGVFTKNPDEIVFYRENIDLRLAALDQLGPVARHAYETACSREHFTPHARLDITEWKAPE